MSSGHLGVGQCHRANVDRTFGHDAQMHSDILKTFLGSISPPKNVLKMSSRCLSAMGVLDKMSTAQIKMSGDMSLPV